MPERPYTTKELLEKFRIHRGIAAGRQYINAVITRSKAHPLKAAYLARGMWDRAAVDRYFAKEEKEKP